MADVITRLKVESTEYDSKIKRASQGLLQMEQACRKVGGTLAILEKDELEFVKGLGKMETVSKDARGQLNELTKAFTDLSLQYKRLTDEEKQGDFGKALASSLGELKSRIQDTKKDLADIGQELSGSKFGQFGGVIDTIGHKMGVSANLTELLTSKTALMTAGIGAAVAAIYKGTEAWAKYNSELAKQDQQTTVITGLRGTAADHMTDTMRALSDTYKVDFRQAIEAANTLMSQFGASGDEAIQLIKDGMQGMIQGDGGKLLNMIQQFAPAFRDAGISADKLVAIIHNSEGGLFSDQNMNAILMGIKNIRLMTKATSDSLAKLGIDGQEMSRKMADGSMTVFEALKQVATKLKDCEAGSQEAGQVMQNVFGRQGAMQGMKLARAIAELNTNLEETKKQTGELGDAFAELQTANEKLNTAIRDAFGYDGWEQMATGIKAKLVTALSAVIEKLADIKNMLFGISTEKTKKDFISGENGQVNVDKKIEQLKGSNYKEVRLGADLREFDKEISKRDAELQKLQKAAQQPGQTNFLPEINRLKAERDALKEMREDYVQRASEVIYGSTNKKKESPEPPKSDSIETDTKTTTNKSVTSTAKELNPMQQAQKEISALTEEALTADERRLEVIKKEIAALQEQVNVYKSIQDFVQGKEPNWNIQVGDRKAFEAEQKKIFEANGGTASRLESMQYSVMKEIKVEDTKVDTETLHTLLKDALQNSIDTTSLDLTTIAEQIGEGINVPDEKWQAILDKYNELKAAIGEEPIQIDFNTGKITEDGKKADKAWQQAASAVQSVGSAFSQIEDPGVKAMGTVMQAIASIALGFAQASAQAGSMGPWAWLAFLAAGAAATATTIATIHSLTGYAEGGIVQGNSYSGDNIGGLVDGSQFVGLDAGELILNRSQQGVLAEALTSGNNQGGVASLPYVTGEKIVMGVNNWARRNGRGELVFSK